MMNEEREKLKEIKELKSEIHDLNNNSSLHTKLNRNTNTDTNTNDNSEN